MQANILRVKNTKHCVPNFICTVRVFECICLLSPCPAPILVTAQIFDFNLDIFDFKLGIFDLARMTEARFFS